MKDAALMVAFGFAVFALLGWASAPSAVMAERTKTEAAQARVVALQTNVAILTDLVPTARPCHAAPPYFTAC